MNRCPFLLPVALLALAAGCASVPPPSGAPAATPPPAPAPARPFNVLGREDAPLMLIEFTDLQCPYCARHALETFPRLKRDYVDTGKLRYSSRDLPLARHAFAVPAAVASRCAGEQGKFWEFREALFAVQRTFGTEPYARIAGELGLDVARLEACRADGRQAAEVQADLQLAAQTGIRSTPTFVLGRVVNGEFQGEQFTGAQPYENFAARIDAMLQAAR